MPQVIQTNVASLNAQRNLDKSQGALQTSLQRLSSGLRINSAKDDAAGLAIVQRFTAQIRGLDQASRNANNGISIAQVAEGALDESTNNLQRIRELSIQSANGSNGAGERANIQAEVSQLVAEIDRIATTTRFGSRLLLDGSFGNTNFQVGAQANETISITVGSARATALGVNSLDATGGSITGTVVTGDDTDNGAGAVVAGDGFTVTTNVAGTTSTTSPITYAAGASATEIAAAINTGAGGVGVTATASNSVTIDALSSAGAVTFDLVVGSDTTQTTTAIAVTVTDNLDLTGIANAINGQTSTHGVTATFTTDGITSSLTLTSLDGSNIGIGTYTNDAGATETLDFGGSTLTEGGTVDAVKTGTVALSSDSGSITLNSADAEFTNVSASSFEGVNAIDVTTEAGAQSAIAVVDAALNSIASQRADLGAIQNRLQSTISNLSSIVENVSSARSRIQDADFASETASLTKNQILQQAGISVLSQANTLPQQVLSLLQ
jgi:flagellin